MWKLKSGSTLSPEQAFSQGLVLGLLKSQSIQATPELLQSSYSHTTQVIDMQPIELSATHGQHASCNPGELPTGEAEAGLPGGGFSAAPHAYGRSTSAAGTPGGGGSYQAVGFAYGGESGQSQMGRAAGGEDGSGLRGSGRDDAGERGGMGVLAQQQERFTPCFKVPVELEGRLPMAERMHKVCMMMCLHVHARASAYIYSVRICHVPNGITTGVYSQ